ncbi:ribonuclease P protein component [Salimicrobium halophilum]|uniref:Ribonuclease P protein component n=1 Tax=Salimicrobium halophilum TaxID=86666 RepID=A0A1G8UQ46_9BACI|nr:ribonuclease P protein component [Salimicrobium halophilum]SDJ55849.1 ribonuclease P protein component [Salimicrobium halophilum]
MKKAYRIKKNKEFQNVFKNGKSFANRQLVLYYLQKDQPHFRIGLSVSKRIGNAVMRNQVKRYLRQAFHELEEDVKADYDLVVIARKPVNTMDYHEIKKSLQHVLKRSGVMKKKSK